MPLKKPVGAILHVWMCITLICSLNETHFFLETRDASLSLNGRLITNPQFLNLIIAVMAKTKESACSQVVRKLRTQNGKLGFRFCSINTLFFKGVIFFFPFFSLLHVKEHPNFRKKQVKGRWKHFTIFGACINLSHEVKRLISWNARLKKITVFSACV